MSLLDVLGLARILKAGVEVTPTRKKIDFRGDGVSITDDPASESTVVNITGSGSGVVTSAAVLAALVGQEIKSLVSPTTLNSATTRGYVDTADALKADKSTPVNAGAGLTGGGTLGDASITLNVVADPDGSIAVAADSIKVGALATDSQHGSRGGGGLHALAVADQTDAVASRGFLSGALAYKIANIAANATRVLISSALPLMDGTAAAGATGDAADAGHRHPTDTTRAAAATTVAAGNGLTGGGDLTANRTLTVQALDASIAVAAGGVSVGVLQNDTQHGTRGGGTTHPVAVASGAAGFISGTDQAKLNGFVGPVATSAGAADAGKVPKTSSDGYLDPSLIKNATSSVAGLQSTTDKARVDLLYAVQNSTKTQRRSRRLDGWTGDPNAVAWQLRGSSPVTISIPSGGTSDQSKWLIDLSPEFPPNAIAISSIDVRIKGPSGQTNVPFGGSLTAPFWVLASYDASGTRTVEITSQADTSSTAGAYTAAHSIAWTGSIAFSPSKRYVLEITGEQGGAAIAGTQLVGLTIGIDYYDTLDALVNAMSPFAWFRADSAVTSSGNVTQLKNRTQGATDVLNLSGTAVAAATADASFNGQLSLTITNTRAVSSRPPSDWRFTHNGNGVTQVHVYLPAADGRCIAGSTAGGANVGFQFYGSSSGLIGSYIYNGSSSFSLASAINNADIPLNAPAAAFLTYSSTLGLGVSNNPGRCGGAFSAFTAGTGDAQTTFTLWDCYATGALVQFSGRWAESLVFDRVVSALELQYLREYVQARYGIQAMLVTSAGKRILGRAPFSFATMDNVTVSGGKVTAVSDLARHGHSYAQSTSAQQCSAPTASANFKGRPTLVGAGAQGYSSTLPAAAWSASADGSGWDSFAVALATSNSGNRTLMGTTSAANVQGLSWFGPAGNNWLSGTIYKTGGTVANLQTLAQALSSPFVARVSHGTARSPQVAHKTTGQTEQTNAYASAALAATAPQHSLNLMMNAGGASGWVGEYAAAVTFNRTLTVQEAADTYADLLELYGAAA